MYDSSSNIRDGCLDHSSSEKSREIQDPFEGRDDLYGLMRRCGHVLYHRRGGKKSQDRILRILSHHESMTQKDLQDCLGIQPGSVSEILSKLEVKGFLIRQRDEMDKRCMIIRETKEGREEARKLREADDMETFAALCPAEQDELRILLKKLLISWEEDASEDPAHIQT